MDWTWGSEAIPLAFSGFRVKVIQESDGNYHVILTPGESLDVTTQEASLDSPCSPEDDWKNHGAYVRCVAHHAFELFAQGLISKENMGELISEAARSDVGKKGEDIDDDGDDRKDKKKKSKRRK